MSDPLRHTHWDKRATQKLTHSHPGGEREHGYFEHPEDGYREESDASGAYLVRTDGSLPDTSPDRAPEQLAVNLPVLTDQHGYRWIQVGPDAYVPLDGQLLVAIIGKWRTVGRAVAEDANGPLIPMTAATGIG
jgi:hypothetical protein